jgi:hypothetical protein
MSNDAVEHIGIFWVIPHSEYSIAVLSYKVLLSAAEEYRSTFKKRSQNPEFFNFSLSCLPGSSGVLVSGRDPSGWHYGQYLKDLVPLPLPALLALAILRSGTSHSAAKGSSSSTVSQPPARSLWERGLPHRAQMERMGWRTLGIEPPPLAIAIARAQLCRDVSSDYGVLQGASDLAPIRRTKSMTRNIFEPTSGNSKIIIPYIIV